MIERICAHCQKTFRRYPSRIKVGAGTYCSRPCMNDHRRGVPVGPRSLFWDRVDKTNGCWQWTGSISPEGYGRLGRHDYAHRIAYSMMHGPIPPKHDIDHLCHNADRSCPGGPCKHRRCVRPDHLEAVRHRENLKRGKERFPNCKQGHPLSGENLYTPARGGRQCRTCRRLALRRHRQRIA